MLNVSFKSTHIHDCDLCTYEMHACMNITHNKKIFLRVNHGPGVVALNFNPSTLEADRGGSQASGSAW